MPFLRRQRRSGDGKLPDNTHGESMNKTIHDPVYVSLIERLRHAAGLLV
jgi:hypothetical protein